MTSDYAIFQYIVRHKEELIGGFIILVIAICAGFLITACFAKEPIYWIIQAGKAAMIALILIATTGLISGILGEIQRLKKS